MKMVRQCRRSLSVKKSVFAFALFVAGIGSLSHDAWALLGLTTESNASGGVSTENRLDAQTSQDSHIRANVMDVLSAEPAFQTQGISADVQGGVVRLKGKVSSESEKELAARIVAQQVSGAQRILNEISVDSSLQAKAGLN